MSQSRIQTAAKALLLLGIALFLWTRLSGGTLSYYVSPRFWWLTIVGMIGLVIVALSYRWPSGDQPAHDHNHEHEHEHEHEHTDHEHAHHNHTEHVHHRLRWGGALIVALPILFGLLVPAQPLGASALGNREIDISSSALPQTVQAAAEKSALSRNILDWMRAFQSGDPTQYVGEEAQVTGFVFHDERLAENQFLVARFTVNCCAADAQIAWLVAETPDAGTLVTNEWVEVRGIFGEGGESGLPVLQVSQLAQVDIPNFPYLYP